MWGVGNGVFEVQYLMGTPNLMFLLHSVSGLLSDFRVHVNLFLSTYCMPSTDD